MTEWIKNNWLKIIIFLSTIQMIWFYSSLTEPVLGLISNTSNINRSVFLGIIGFCAIIIGIVGYLIICLIGYLLSEIYKKIKK